MRYWIYILGFLVLSSCEVEETFFNGPYHVRFTEISDSKLESYSPIIPVSVHLVGPQLDEDMVISYSIGGNARQGRDYEILSDENTVEISRGKSFGYINIRLINNSNNILESQTLTITLESVSVDGIDIGFGPGVKVGSTYTLEIVDDCILGGSYTGTNQPNQPSISGIHITSQDCIEYLLENWDIGVFNFSDVRNLVFTDNGDNTLNIPEQEESTLISEQATIRGNGVVDPITREIILNIELVDFEGSPIVTIKYQPE